MDKSKEDNERTEVRDESLAVTAGEELHPLQASQVPKFLTTNFRFDTIEELRDLAEGRARHYLYTRNTNPTNEAVEAKAAALERGERGLVLSSGMAAISSAVLGVVERGDHVLASASLYGGTVHFLQDILGRFGVEVEAFNILEWEALPKRFRPNSRLLIAESPTNPALQVLPLGETAQLARAQGVLTLMDNTFATPVNQKPLQLGWDIVVHSATKYLSGHSDVTAGVVVSSGELISRIEPVRRYLGGTLDPSAAYMLLRGMKTLPLRVERQNESALAIARFLEGHPRVSRVRYPLLPSHPQFELARRQMKGGGGVLSFHVRGGWEATRVFFNGLRRIPISTSLGGVESLVTSPVLTSHYGLDPEALRVAEVADDMVRLSVGIEAVEDLCADLDLALRASGVGRED